MNLNGNTVFITGGGSGIGRGLAEAFYKRGNHVIIGGRHKEQLKAVTDSYPGMECVEIDITQPVNVRAAARWLTENHPKLNVLINNAGIAGLDQPSGLITEDHLTGVVGTNLLGPIRLTSALIDQITKNKGVVIYNTSALAFVPYSNAAVLSASKAALHSYILSQRFQLRQTGVRVVELAPPWVRTDMLNSREAEPAMPLDEFIAESMDLLATDNDEILVERAKPFRDCPGQDEYPRVCQLNEMMLTLMPSA